jgi:hypothetical protein
LGSDIRTPLAHRDGFGGLFSFDGSCEFFELISRGKQAKPVIAAQPREERSQPGMWVGGS